MADSPEPFPLDLSGHRDLPPGEIAPLLERAASAADERAITALTALLMNRLLRLLRQGSRQEILEEALMLNRFLAVEAGSHLRQCRPETYGGWSTLGELLSGAARSTSRAAVPALLRSTQGHGLAILEVLAAEGRAIPRAELRRRLSLGEAHLSHLLRDLEEADLVVRYRPQEGKVVLVELGPTGREVVSQSILPPWLEHLENAISEISKGFRFHPQTLARELEEAGAPSRLIAERLAGKLVQMAPPFAPEEKSNISYFLSPKTWKVTNVSGALTRFLPEKGSTVKIERQLKGIRIVPMGRSESAQVFDGFRFQKGRLELHTRIQDADCVLVIEEDRTGDKARLKGKIEPRGMEKRFKPLPELMTGTWGAEAGGAGAEGPEKLAKAKHDAPSKSGAKQA